MEKKATPFGIKNAGNKNPTMAPGDDTYANCLQEKNQHGIVDYLFQPNQFINWWEKYRKQPDKLRALRIMVQIGTIHAFLRGKYFLPDGQAVSVNKKQIEQIAKSTKMYSGDYNFQFPKSEIFKTVINIIDGDCIEAALWLKSKNLNPACLNMASSSNPGGGYKKGSGAQEENLFRRTCLFHCLDDPYHINPSKSWSYPIPEFGGIYVKDCLVIRDSEAKGYAFLDKPATLSFVCVSAYSNPPIEEQNGELIIGKKIAQKTKKKISTILSIALAEGHDSIVLSALGCGAYGNPPKHVATLFKEVIQSFDGKFKEIVFAIIDDHNTGQDHNPDGNLNAFEQVYKITPITL